MILLEGINRINEEEEQISDLKIKWWKSLEWKRIRKKELKEISESHGVLTCSIEGLGILL